MQELFKGYVPTKNKECLMKFKGKSANQLKSLREVSRCDEYAGIIAENVAVIDIDDYEQSEILMNIVEDLQLRCRVYETSRGKHFFFMNDDRISSNKTKSKLAIGLESDVKLGSRNSYSILKYKNVERKIIYDIFQDEEYETVPKWLLPIKTNMDFLDMTNGDGRNQALFNYILTLQSNDYSVDEARETIRIINKYVLSESLTDDELDVILRDDAFAKPVFFKKSVFLFDKFATYLKNNSHIIRLDGQLHIYRNGVYVNGAREIESEMIATIPNLNKAKRSETMSYIELLVNRDARRCSANLIAFKNGIYNLETDSLEPFSPNVVITNKIDYDYIADAYSEVTDRTLNKLACHDESVRALLEEAIGYCFFRRNELRKMFILTGDKQNGKSTFLSMIENLLGQNNTSSLDLKELGDRFKPAQLAGKLANIGDDIGDEFIANAAILKKLASGNPINVENKGADPFDFSNYAKLLFSANNIPRIKDKSGAVQSRLIIIPFDARFSPDDDDYDPYIKDKLTTDEAMEYIIQLGIAGLKRILRNRAFTKSEKVERSLEEYEQNNNPVLLFFNEIDNTAIENEPTRKVYMKYTEFCIENSFTPMSNIEFSKQVKKHLGFEIINKTVKGKKHRIFVKKGD